MSDKGFDPLDPKDAAKLDQSSSFMADNMPPMLWRFYQGCIACGFDVPQSTLLTKTILERIMAGR